MCIYRGTSHVDNLSIYGSIDLSIYMSVFLNSCWCLHV